MARVAAFPLSAAVFLPLGIPSRSPPPPFSPQESPLPFEVKGCIFVRWICGNDDDDAGASGRVDQWSIFIDIPELEAAIACFSDRNLTATEVRQLLKMQHRNLVSLLGCCASSAAGAGAGHKMLVYPVLPQRQPRPLPLRDNMVVSAMPCLI